MRATDAAGNVDASPASHTWTVDATAPTLASGSNSLKPADGATGVQRGTAVSATFSENMDATTLTKNTFTLLKEGTSTQIAATVSYDPATKTVTLKPSSRLEANKKYRATITTGAKDTVDNPLAADKAWYFTTGSK